MYFCNLLWFSFVLVRQCLAQSPDLKSCLVSAVGGDRSRAAFPGDFLYGLLNVKRYNLYYDIIPAAVVYPKSAVEVSQAVKCAANGGAKVQARSGGHSFGDYCIGGVSGAVVLDLQHLNQITYDDSSKTANIGPGCLLEDVGNALIKYGRTAVHGTAPQVGIGGHLTIGGLGPLSRQFGTGADQIVSAEVVLANGSVVPASESINPDLYFALQGAGASFGVVTSFNVNTVAAESNAVMLTYNVSLGDSKEQADALISWQDMVAQPNLSRRFASDLAVFDGGVAATGTYFGSKADFDEMNLTLQLPGNESFNVDVIDNAVGVVGGALLNATLKFAGGIPVHFYSKSLAFRSESLFTREGAAAMFEYLQQSDTSGLTWFVLFDLQGGATNDKPTNATAYPFRNTLYFMQSYAIDFLGLEINKTRTFLDGLNRVVTSHVIGAGGAYPGYVDPFLENAQANYWSTNLPRLESIKALLDPDDIFNNPQSVQRSGQGQGART